MKKLWYLTSFLIISAFSFTSGCDGLFKCSGDYLGFESTNKHIFELYDYMTGEPLLGIFGKYHRDTVKVYDISGRIYFNGPVDNSGRVLVYLVDEADKGMIDQQIERELYLYLNYQDTDTLRYEFTMTRDECDYQVYKHTKLTYNDSIYIDESNYGYRSVKLYKK